MEEDATEELVALHDDLVAVEVEPLHRHDLRPDDLERETREREAALFVAPFAGRLDDLRVEQHVGAVADVVDEEALLHTDLGRGQADTRRVVHRLVHGVDELRRATRRSRPRARPAASAPGRRRPGSCASPSEAWYRGGPVRAGSARRSRARVDRPRPAPGRQRARARQHAAQRVRERVRVAGLHEHRPSLGPAPGTPRDCSSPAATVQRGVVTGELGERAERRVPERAPPGAISPSVTICGRPATAARTTSCSGTRVCNNSRVSSRAAPGEQLRAADEQPERLRRRRGTRREQLLVEVEVRDERRTPAPDVRAVQHGFGADDDVGGAGASSLSVSTSTDGLRRDERRELLPHAAHTGAHDRSRASPHAGQISGRSALLSQRKSS